MNNTLTSQGIHPLDRPESEAGSRLDLHHILLSESINLRDLSEAAAEFIQPGRLRSSQVVSPTQLKKLGVKV